MTSLRETLAAFAVVAAAATSGCSNEKPSHAPNVTPCEDKSCDPSAGGGTGVTPDGGATSDASTTSDAGGASSVSGAVLVTTDSLFQTGAKYTGIVTVSAAESAGVVQNVTSGGAYSLTGLTSGPTWFGVADQSGGTSLVPTIELVSVGAGTTTADLLAVDYGGFRQGYDSVNTGPNPFGSTSGVGYLVASFRSGGAPVAGITLSSSGGASLVAYDSGGALVTTPTHTGSAGVVVVYGITATAFPGVATSFGYAYTSAADGGADAGSPGVFTVPIASGWVTLATVDLP